MVRQHLSVRFGSKGSLLLESWLTDVGTSKGRVRGSRTPAPVHPDTHVRARQAFDFHNASARRLWKSEYLQHLCCSNYTKGCRFESYLRSQIEEANGASSGHPEAGANRSSSQVEHGKSNFCAQLSSIVTISIISAALIHEAKKFSY